MIEELAKAVRERKVILFVGSGVSKNLGLPLFSELVQHLAVELNYDPEIFATHGDYLALAEYYQLVKGTIGPLRSWMDRTWHTGVDLSKSEIHKLIVELDFPIIYTTNYDTWLEQSYALQKRDYVKIANGGDLIKVKPGVAQIIKFHGDTEDDASIVLTESSYFSRLDFESPLDIKLRSDLLGKSVLFIGCSLSDINIRYMLYKLNLQWKSSSYTSARPNSFIFLARPNPVQEKVLSSRGIQAIVSDADNPEIGLRKFLKHLLREGLGRA
ncbi:MAG TPA: SIR2 family protein [Nitrospiraceae bacterium]|nr:SIR2 family protein [Nitrospiraceae bacterium]